MDVFHVPDDNDICYDDVDEDSNGYVCYIDDEHLDDNVDVLMEIQVLQRRLCAELQGFVRFFQEAVSR